MAPISPIHNSLLTGPMTYGIASSSSHTLQSSGVGVPSARLPRPADADRTLVAGRTTPDRPGRERHPHEAVLACEIFRPGVTAKDGPARVAARRTPRSAGRATPSAQARLPPELFHHTLIALSPVASIGRSGKSMEEVMVNAVVACSVVLALVTLYCLARFADSRPGSAEQHAIGRIQRLLRIAVRRTAHRHEQWLRASDLECRERPADRSPPTGKS